MRINPKQSDFKHITVKEGYEKLQGHYLTNLFEFATQPSEKVFIYKVQTVPPIRPDATKTWYRVINAVKFQLERELKMITFRGDTVWAETEKATFSTTANLDRKRRPQQQEGQQQGHNCFNVLVTCCGGVSFEQMHQQEDKSLRPLFVQMINTNIKQKLSELGYEELGKGKFYNRANLAVVKTQAQSNVKGYGLNVVSGFRCTLCCLAPLRNYMHIDIATRILRTRSLYEEIISAKGTENDKILMFRGATVITRYGNYRTFKV